MIRQKISKKKTYLDEKDFMKSLILIEIYLKLWKEIEVAINLLEIPVVIVVSRWLWFWCCICELFGYYFGGIGKHILTLYKVPMLYSKTYY